MRLKRWVLKCWKVQGWGRPTWNKRIKKIANNFVYLYRRRKEVKRPFILRTESPRILNVWLYWHFSWINNWVRYLREWWPHRPDSGHSRLNISTATVNGYEETLRQSSTVQVPGLHKRPVRGRYNCRILSLFSRTASSMDSQGRSCFTMLKYYQVS